MKQQQLVQPWGVLIPAKHVLSWSQNGMRIKHVLMLHKCSPLLTPKMSLPLLLFSVLWQVVFSIQIFTNSQDSGILIQHAFNTWPRRQRVSQKGYEVEHFFIWHHCSCSPIPSMCNTTTKKHNNPFWRSNPMPTLKLSATIKFEMLEIQYYRWMAGHISYSSVVFGLGNSQARKQQNALRTCHDSPTQKPELIWNCATRLCLVICALLPTPRTKVMLGQVCVVIYDEGSARWGTSKYKGKLRSGLGFKMQEEKKLVTRMSSQCLTCFGSLDRQEWVLRTPQEQAAGTPRSRKWSWKTQGRRCPAKGAARPTVAVHASSAPHPGPGSETWSRRRPCWRGATGWSSKEPTSSQLSAGTTKGTTTKNTTELRIIKFQVSSIRSLTIRLLQVFFFLSDYRRRAKDDELGSTGCCCSSVFTFSRAGPTSARL